MVKVKQESIDKLAEVSPLWAELLSENGLGLASGYRKTESGKVLSLGTVEMCLVGEAHKFNYRNYMGCCICTSMSFSIINIILWKKLDKFSDWVTVFVGHFKQVHKNGAI